MITMLYDISLLCLSIYLSISVFGFVLEEKNAGCACTVDVVCFFSFDIISANENVPFFFLNSTIIIYRPYK